MKIGLLFIVSIFVTGSAMAQTADSSAMMQELLVSSYNTNRKLVDVSAAVVVVGQTQLNRFGNNSILPAINANPGVRMEERSPGSFRFNVRGSSLRSPFGVRDVKVYFNEIPLTDPGGNTYLNQLGFYNFQSIEIIKGPAGSMYGAGTGGAVLVKSMPADFKKGIDLNYTAASFANNHVNATIRLGKPGNQNVIGYSHQTSNGYRQQTEMRRDVASWESLFKINEQQTIHTYVLYADLMYQTPGALTKAEYESNPKQARPSIGAAPGAVQNKAAIYQKNFTVGVSHEYHFNSHWQNTTAVYGAYTDFTNPGIRVYEKRKEPHVGGRSVVSFNKNLGSNQLQLNAGVEMQKGFFNTKDYRNKTGEIDTLQTDDDTDNWLYSVFAQADIKIRKSWIITAGASFNKSSVTLTRLSKRPVIQQNQTFENKIAPRIALLKKINPAISIYASISKGFSTPTAAELLRSNGIIENGLQPADGINYELGAKGILLNNKLQFDINLFYFQLKNTIVQRIDTSGVFYYLNAGATKQQGVELSLTYAVINKPKQFVSGLKLWSTYANHDFHYKDFKQVANDFSGKLLPGVAPHNFVAGLDLELKEKCYANLTCNYTDKIALNDANSDYASSCNLLSVRIGYKKINLGKAALDIFAGADNIFNVQYSLGNDINAAAGRYYNAAPEINYYAGLSFKF